ncbi:MFS transporter [Halobacillus sp. BBL2006]|uniref:MFS transporter n=1 Tax=Halobacillus sp. BBL2006 TaxID=1543706 RepID=UPI0005421FCD|nr:MFS transporter [Halobacillus sp. BBL2006]KHE72130.1 MFS transporter [Halobacillus sp. BBL2006]
MNQAEEKFEALGKVREFKTNGQVFRFIGGNLVSFFGDQIYMIALPLIVLAITGSPLSMGIVAALERLPVLIQPIAGVIADRFNRKTILLVCDILRSLIIGAMGLLHINGFLLMWEVFVGALVIGVLTQIYNTSQFASIPRLVQKKDLQLANSVNTGIFNMAVFIGPGLGGILVSFFHPGWALLLNSASFFIGFLTVFSLKLAEEVHGKIPKTWWAEIKEGFVFVKNQKPILYTNLAMLFSVFGTTLFLTMMIVHLKLSIQMNAAQIGWLLSIGGGGAVAGSLLTNLLKRKFSYRTILFTAGITGGISIVLFGGSQTFISLAVMNMVGTISAAIMSPCIVTIRQILTPDRLLGRVQATSRFMTWLSMPVAAFLAGILGEHLSTGFPIILGGVISTLATFIYLHPSLNRQVVE